MRKQRQVKRPSSYKIFSETGLLDKEEGLEQERLVNNAMNSEEDKQIFESQQQSINDWMESQNAPQLLSLAQHEQENDL